MQPLRNASSRQATPVRRMQNAILENVWRGKNFRRMREEGRRLTRIMRNCALDKEPAASILQNPNSLFFLSSLFSLFPFPGSLETWLQHKSILINKATSIIYVKISHHFWCRGVSWPDFHFQKKESWFQYLPHFYSIRTNIIEFLRKIWAGKPGLTILIHGVASILCFPGPYFPQTDHSSISPVWNLRRVLNKRWIEEIKEESFYLNYS